MSATWDIFQSAKLEVRRGLSTAEVRQALARGEILDDDLARPAGTTIPWTRLADVVEMWVTPEPEPQSIVPTTPEPPPPSEPVEPASEPHAAVFDPIRTSGDRSAWPPLDHPIVEPPGSPPPDANDAPAPPASTAAFFPAAPRDASAEWSNTRDFAAAVWNDESLEAPVGGEHRPSFPSADFESFATDQDFSFHDDGNEIAQAELDDEPAVAQFDDEPEPATPPGIAPLEAAAPTPLMDEPAENDEPALLASGSTTGVEDLDLTAMADIAMQMIMFLLVAATVVYFKTLEIPAPNPDEGQAVAQEMKTLEDLMDDFILVEITADGTVSVDREPIPADQLIARLRKARTDTLRTSMLLSAEFATPHASAVAALDAANEIGLAIALAKPTGGIAPAPNP